MSSLHRAAGFDLPVGVQRRCLPAACMLVADFQLRAPAPCSHLPAMAAERLLTRRLAAFLAVVALVLGSGLVIRAWPVSLAHALAELQDGDPDRDERRALLRRVLALGRSSEVPLARLQAVMATVALDDADEFAVVAPPLGGEAFDRVPAELLAHADAALGDTVVAALLVAIAAERRGDRAAAAAGYGRVGAQSRLWGMVLVGRLASAGARRVG